VPQVVGLGGESALSLQSFKNAFSEIYTKGCLKMRIFWNNSAKITSALGALPPNPRLSPTAGGFTL